MILCGEGGTGKSRIVQPVLTLRVLRKWTDNDLRKVPYVPHPLARSGLELSYPTSTELDNSPGISSLAFSSLKRT